MVSCSNGRVFLHQYLNLYFNGVLLNVTVTNIHPFMFFMNNIDIFYLVGELNVEVKVYVYYIGAGRGKRA